MTEKKRPRPLRAAYLAVSLIAVLLIAVTPRSTALEPEKEPENWGYVVTVDGEVLGACPQRERLSQLILAARESIVPPEAESVELCGTLAIEHRPVTREELLPPEKLADALRGALRLRWTETVKQVQAVDYPVLRQEDPTMILGQETVLQEGEQGRDLVCQRIIRVNGQETGRQTLSTHSLKAPVEERIAVGTKKTGPTGTFHHPFAAGTLSSDYGWRSRGFHTGVDFCGAAGSPVAASDGGTVIFTGWSGGYGNLVKIAHGNGVETWYAHNSAFTVEEGQEVAQGDTIALVGSTGNSTGPHCHFEVRINGEHRNPWEFLELE